jgi:hypothetical protein
MDEETRELIREALALYKRHVEAVEAYSRRYSGKALWMWLLIFLIAIPIVIPLTSLLAKKLGLFPALP